MEVLLSSAYVTMMRLLVLAADGLLALPTLTTTLIDGRRGDRGTLLDADTLRGAGENGRDRWRPAACDGDKGVGGAEVLSLLPLLMAGKTPVRLRRSRARRTFLHCCAEYDVSSGVYVRETLLMCCAHSAEKGMSNGLSVAHASGARAADREGEGE